MELLERESQLAELHELLSQAAAGDGGFVLLGGEAGVGKTALVNRFVIEIRKNARVLSGACDPLSTPRPLGPLHDVAAATGGPLASLLQNTSAREELFGGSLRELTAVTGRGPTVLIVEDAHWADEATLDWLRYLGRRLWGNHTLAVITYRDDEVGPNHPLRVALGDLASTGKPPRRMAVRPLSLNGLRRLVVDSDVNAAKLHKLTGGNPFYMTEVLAEGGNGVPPTVQDAVIARAARLSSVGRYVLDAAAVLGSPIETSLLEEVAGAGASDLGECLDRGLLVMGDHGLGFRHELARQAIHDAIAAPRRIQLHKRALTALTSTSEWRLELARIAHHAEGAGDAEAVIEFAPQAARQAMTLRAHREAASQYSRALRFASGLPVEKREELLWGWFRASHAAGASTDAESSLRSLLEIATKAGNVEKMAEIRSWLATELVRAGRNQEGEAESAASLRALEGLPPGPAHVIAYRTQGYLRMLDRDCIAAIDWGDKTVELAERVGDRDSAMAGFNSRGSARILAGREDEGRADLERSIALAREAGNDLQVANGYVNLGSAFGEVFSLEVAERYLTEGMAVAEQSDIDGMLIYMQAWLGLVRCYQGRWNEAVTHSEAVLQRPRAMAISRMMALVGLGRVRARRGDPEVGSALDTALELANPTGTLQRLGPVRAARAEAAWLTSDRARTAAEATAAYQLALDHHHAWLGGELAYWLWRSGKLTEAPRDAAEPYRLQIAGEWAEAAAQWDRLGCPYEAARARADAVDEASLRVALGEFERLGAGPAAAAVTRQLRAIGVHSVPRGPRPRTRANPAGLTGRELEVAILVSEGLTNGQIAERLFLSAKTVERHVSAVLAKLDLTSRAGVGRAVSALGFASQDEGGTSPS